MHVPLRYFIRLTSLLQSSLSAACTLVVKNAIAVQVSDLAHLVAYSVCLGHQVVKLHSLFRRQEILAVFVDLLEEILRSSST
jgi:hypothetical protein